MNTYDIIIIGAGAAGLSAAATALARGRRVAVFDMGPSPARKVLASGGGRCNITNMAAGPDRYAGNNPNFVRGALSRVSPRDVLDWATEHGIGLHEKTPGRCFCNDGAGAVVEALMRDADGADFFYNQTVSEIKKSGNMFQVNSMFARAVIVATGGISFGTLGVSDAGYKIAKQFGHKIVPVRPALCALNVTGIPSDFAGISVDAEITIGKRRISDSLLLTHSGIGGPLAYRTSLFDIQKGFVINWVPHTNMLDEFKTAKQCNGRKTITGIISEYLPIRIARWIGQNDTRNVADVKDMELMKIAERIHKYEIPAGNAKYHSMTSAEVTFGGVDTNDISSKTMESKLCPGLYFAGEVIDITGDLGGFNLQWAWASGRVAGMNACAE